MKKTIAVICCIIVASLGIIMTGCGDEYADSPYVGTWSATTASYSGIEMDASSFFEDFSVTFDASGKCTVSLNDEESTGNWEPTESGLKISDSTDEEMAFTDNDGVLVLEYDGVNINFEKK